MKKKKIKSVLQILAIIACLCLGGYGYIVYERTIINWWLPVASGVLAASATAPFLNSYWKFFTASSQMWTNVLCHVFFTGILVYSFILIGNKEFSGSQNKHETVVSVVEREMVKRNTYRRVGRHRYVANGHRYDYYLVIATDGGNKKRLPVSHYEYSRARNGSSITAMMQQGFFGYPVITGLKN